MARSRVAVCFGEDLDLDLVLGEAPATADALVVPQDIHLILGEATVIEDTGETPAEALAALLGRERPRRRGTVLVSPGSDGSPLLLQAIVYDFEDSPPAREIHVFESLLAAFEEATRRRLKSVAVRPLGTAHAGLAPAAFVRLLAQVCFTAAELGTTLRHVHLVLPSPDELASYERLVRELLLPRL
jgi:hypothetical protein